MMDFKKHPLYQEDLINAFNGVEDFFNGKSFLITGATGLIGTFLIDVLMKANEAGAGISIYAVGRSGERAKERFGEYFQSSLFTFIQQDVIVPFNDSIHVDFVVPLASNTHPLAYSAYPIETALINFEGAKHSLDLAYRCGAEVLYPSSVEIYGNAGDVNAITEDYTGKLNLSNARSCYPESKRLSEALCQAYKAEKGICVKIARLSRVFGPTMLMNDSKASSQFLKKAISGDDIVLKSSGLQRFSYTYVADAVNAMLFIIKNGDNGVAYNISAQSCDVQLKQFAQICASIAGKDVVFEVPDLSEKRGYSVAVNAIMDNSLLKSIGWTPQYTMENAVSRTVILLK